jgi:hypothetical protein
MASPTVEPQTATVAATLSSSTGVSTVATSEPVGAQKIVGWQPLAGVRWSPSTPEQRRATQAMHDAQLEQWRRHPNYRREMAAGHLVEDVHTMFRRGFQGILDECDFAKQKGGKKNSKGSRRSKNGEDDNDDDVGLQGPLPDLHDSVIETFERWLTNLEGHHTGEDKSWFPRIARRNPELKKAFDYLSKDHQHLHPLEVRVVQKKDEAALREFVSFLDDHLNREEMLIVPLALAGLA